MTRSMTIKWLRWIQNMFPKDSEQYKALDYAISSLVTDKAYQLKYEHIPTITITVEEYMHLRECEDKCKNDKPLIKCNICKYYTKMEGCLNDRCERFKDTTHPYCYCYWGKEKGAD